MKKELFFIGLMPDPETADRITALKQLAAQRFQSKRALRSPPHITLFPPFRFGKLFELKQSLSEFIRLQSPDPMLLRLRGFDHFGNRVIFVAVEPSEPLNRLQQSLERHLFDSLDLEKPGPHGFHPHLTVAFRDLDRDQFGKAWAYFRDQSFEAVFSVAGIHLFGLEESGWQTRGFFPFSG